MKTMRLFLIVTVMAGALNSYAASKSQHSLQTIYDVQMHSSSPMVKSGSALSRNPGANMYSTSGMKQSGWAYLRQPGEQMYSTSAMAKSGSALFQYPGDMMHSTSVMTNSGSSLSQTEEIIAKAIANIRRAASDEDEGDAPPADPHGPNEEPVGDIPAVLMALLVAGYICLKKKKYANLTNNFE